MTIALRYAAYSDVGCLREGNEDSAYAGPHLLAVADGMGGHAGGEIASAIALNALEPLDGDIPASQMAESLEEAVDSANTTIARHVQDDPKLENMGTTLTAMLLSGSRLVLIHVGDSRAYLLRGSEFTQLTHDHTLVQTLVDEGKITEEEVATHPQRSLLLRALNGQGEVDPDIRVYEVELGDRYLLCSDGLSGVVSEDTIRETLGSETSPETAARRLIDLANRGGGPDNITAVIADVIETDTDIAGPTTERMWVGAADQRREPLMTPDTPAGRAQEMMGKPQEPREEPARDTAEMDPVEDVTPAEPPEPAASEPGTRRWWPMVVTFLVVVTVVAVAGFILVGRFLDSQYFVGPDEGTGDNVALYQGLNTDVLGFDLWEQVDDTGIALDSLPQNEQDQVRNIQEFDSEDAAEEMIDRLRAAADDAEADTDADAVADDPDDQDAEANAETGAATAENGSDPAADTDTPDQPDE
ncbi:Stp1/IreP family PP2C-type Ser/Thr phosphatase [Lipingzhangella sp. LS1_29]|uniref:Stp1/IreP family PP2C-type Ser/Thr phosphatase n=1 Tax=Lipingzhangella rawalii TaxID=2055835 RepID=A0ABU2H8M8_9ACTN|nr:Stp1/IreP family PP2C-type Ser/Thr phosphatase [Lipingzhangella rawalii]MDS1271656.1 Stp1/IreP family PP2C-type Ser/Thr phosphatase [Lipingzhangella rawalii]